MAGGLFAAVAFALRNVGVSLMLAGPLALLFALLLGHLTRRTALWGVMSWGISASPVLVALAWRNLRVLGNVHAYGMPAFPLTVEGLLHDTRQMLADLVLSITGNPSIAAHIAWDAKIALSVAALVGALLALAWLMARGNTSRAEQTATLALWLYLVLGLGVVIFAKARYQAWDDLRYSAQYSWLLPFLLLRGIVPLVRNHQAASLFTLFALAALWMGQVLFSVRMLDNEREAASLLGPASKPISAAAADSPLNLRLQLIRRAMEDTALAEWLRAQPSDRVIVSNFGHLGNITWGRPTFGLANMSFDRDEWGRQLQMLASEAGAGWRLRVVLCPSNQFVKAAGSSWPQRAAAYLAAVSFRKLERRGACEIYAPDAG